MKSTSFAAVSSSPTIPKGQSGASSGLSIGFRGRSSVPSGGKGKSIATGNAGDVIPFKDLTLGRHEGELQFRLIHFWEAWNSLTKVLIGIEMLLIDEEGTVVQGFIPYGRIETYRRHMKAGGTYRLNKFFGSANKTNYSVAEASVTITFSWNSVLSDLEDSTIHFPDDRFHYVGHIKLVNGQVPNDGLLLGEAGIAAPRRVDLHVQTHDDPVLKLCLWDKAASEFCEKFRASGGAARVILVTTLNPKRFGVLSLSSMTPTRILDGDVQETETTSVGKVEFEPRSCQQGQTRCGRQPEPASLGELFAYMKQSPAKVAWFECTATIDDVVHDSRWYYIGCGECHTKATKGATTLMCKKCGKDKIVGVPQYLARLSVYDNKDQAVFVVLGDAGEELFGKKASDLVESYYQANESVGADHIVPVPQAMVDTIGQTRKFIVKVSTHNRMARPDLNCDESAPS
ncbi:hypothetical protein Bca52824_052661 [Brassica carinata]|uniref:Replication factor A C-terminal domain-containing protein n=1 Tax=Brassica carinata TaxID=52824 RepID=A0A8X7R469_BRACI|nr:hypothetical protein Bca52824_052661 [Brassica carinata]